MSNEEDDDLSESGQEEGGYEADSESESEADAKRLTDTSSPPQSPVSKGSSVGTITTKSIEAEKYAESLRQKVAYPELCIFVLESLARQMPVSFETDSHNRYATKFSIISFKGF